MILGNLSVKFMSTKQLTITMIIVVLLLVTGLSTRENRKIYIEDIKQHPIRHILALFIG